MLASPPMMTMNSTSKETLMPKACVSTLSELEVQQHRAGDAAIERADGEGRELGLHRPDADQLGGDVHVADRHPRAADAAAHQVLGDQREQRSPG